LEEYKTYHSLPALCAFDLNYRQEEMMSQPKGSQSRRRRSASLPPELEHVHLNAAGIDVGAEAHFVAVPPNRDPNGQEVREFGAFTADLYALADWLAQCGIETVAMESTGVYWIPLFEVLEERGFEVKLVNPRHVKNVPGRKTDVLDCQWLQQLHTYGLLQGAFRPDDQVCVLRSYMRQRAMLVRYASHHIQHMQKALELMNIKLGHVVSDITGVTGTLVLPATRSATLPNSHLFRPECPRVHITIRSTLFTSTY